MESRAAKKQSVFKRLREARLTRGKMDFSILLVISVLCAFGLVMIFSASYYYAQHYSGANNDSFYYLKRQLVPRPRPFAISLSPIPSGVCDDVFGQLIVASGSL